MKTTILGGPLKNDTSRWFGISIDPPQNPPPHFGASEWRQTPEKRPRQGWATRASTSKCHMRWVSSQVGSFRSDAACLAQVTAERVFRRCRPQQRRGFDKTLVPCSLKILQPCKLQFKHVIRFPASCRPFGYPAHRDFFGVWHSPLSIPR